MAIDFDESETMDRAERYGLNRCHLSAEASSYLSHSQVYLWTQQDRSRTPSTPIWSSRLYKRTQDVKSTYQIDPFYLCFLVDPIVRKPSTKPKKNPELPGRNFFDSSPRALLRKAKI